MDLAVQGYSSCGVVWYRTLRVKSLVGLDHRGKQVARDRSFSRQLPYR